MIQVTSSEIFISARTLSVGIYEMTYVSTVYNISSSTTAYFQIIPADVIINLFPFGTSLITHDYQQNLTLNPGLYSYHLDNQPFNASVSSKPNQAIESSHIWPLGLDVCLPLSNL